MKPVARTGKAKLQPRHGAPREHRASGLALAGEVDEIVKCSGSGVDRAFPSSAPPKTGAGEQKDRYRPGMATTVQPSSNVPAHGREASHAAGS